MHKGQYHAMPYGSICCTYHQLKYSSPDRSNKQKRQQPHKRAYLSENGDLAKKRSGECAKIRKEEDREIATGQGRRTREEIYRKVGIKLTALRFRTGSRGKTS